MSTNTRSAPNADMAPNWADTASAVQGTHGHYGPSRVAKRQADMSPIELTADELAFSYQVVYLIN